MKTRFENEMVIAGRLLFVRAMILSRLDDRGDVVITGITEITVNGLPPGPRLARRVKEALAVDDAVYEELCMKQPTQEQMMLELAEAEYDARHLEGRI